MGSKSDLDKSDPTHPPPILTIVAGVWLVVITLLVLIILGANGRRWRVEYCRRRGLDQSVKEDLREDEDDDYKSEVSSVGGMSLRDTYRLQYANGAMDMIGDVSDSSSSASPVHKTSPC